MTTKLNVALYYNQWTGLQNDEVTKCFAPATSEDLNGLKAGDDIWIDEDPIHPNGKVYGFLRSTFKKFENGMVYHSSGYGSLLHKFYILKDEARLRSLIEADPRICDVIGKSGRMASAIVSRMSNSGNPNLN